MPVLRHAFAAHSAIQDIEGSKQGRGPMALVIMGIGCPLLLYEHYDPLTQ